MKPSISLGIVAALLLQAAAFGATYGPFRPAVVADDGGLGAAWMVDGAGVAHASIVGEGTTHYLKVADFGIAGVTGNVQRVHLVIFPSYVDSGFNIADAALLDASGDVFSTGDGLESEDVTLEELADVGFRFAFYAQNGGSAGVTVALFVETD